jgi:hypothetical protein
MMSPGTFTRISGWLLVALLILTISIVYRRRAATLRVTFGRATGPSTGYRNFNPWPGLRPHFVLGFVILALTYLHLDVPLRTRGLGDTALFGFGVASIGAALLLLQGYTGWRIRRRAGAPVPALRALHFWTMVAVIGLIVVHAAVNGSTLAVLRFRSG